jgi:chromosome segregation ATPase
MRKVFLLVCGLAMVAAAPAAPPSDVTALREALRRATAELRAAQDAQAATQAALDQANQQRAALQKQLDDLGHGGQAAPPDATEELRKQLADAQKQNAALQEGLTQMQEQAQKAAAALGAQESQRRQSEAAAKAAGAAIGQCRDKNAKLLQVGHEILHLYETQDFRSLLLKSYEPLLGLKRVELENMVDDYDDKLRDQAWYPPAPPAEPAR